MSGNPAAPSACPPAILAEPAVPVFGDRRLADPPLAALLRLHTAYLWRHRRVLALGRPQRFTELVQRRKLLDRDPRIPRLIDKLAVKRFVGDALGSAWVTPTWWSGEALPAVPPCTPPFLLKSRHGCNQWRLVRSAADWAEARLAAAAWVRRPYGRWLDEWGYRDVPRGLLIEPFLGTGPALPVDYKFYVFHGRVEAVQVHLDRATGHRWLLFDRSWRRLSAGRPDPDPPAPGTLPHMIAGAERLGRGFDFVRVDVYEIGGMPRFGEMTFYPGSGLDPFDPPSLDLLLGSCWTRGEGRRRRPGPISGRATAERPAAGVLGLNASSKRCHEPVRCCRRDPGNRNGLDMRTISISIVAAATCILAVPASAGPHDWETAGDIGRDALVLAAFGVPAAKADWRGDVMAGASLLSAAGATYTLKELVHERRPDGSDDRSFPSSHTSMSFAAAMTLERRHGWKWGLPALGVASFVGASRVAADKHYVHDVLAGAAIGSAAGWLLTSPRNDRTTLLPWAAHGGGGVTFAARW